MPIQFKALANSDVEISITGVIGDDFWSDDPCTADMVRAALAKAPNAKLISAFIDTDGGDVWHGFGIYQAFAEHPGKVVMTVGARAQSCGSLILMAGDEIVMPETSKILAHNPWTFIQGDAARLEKRAKDLRNLEDSFVTAYSSRTGMSEAATRALMDEDRLMSASEALTLGFCTEVKKSKTKAQALSDDVLRANVTRLQLRAQQKASALQAAALGKTTPPAPPAETAKENQMQQLAAFVIAALCLNEGATEADAIGEINKLKASAENGKKVLGLLNAKSVDEAQGTIAALNVAKEQGEKDAAELKALRETTEQNERQSIINKLKTPDANGCIQVTPGQEKDLLPTMSLVGLKAFAATAPKILGSDGRREPRSSDDTAGSSRNSSGEELKFKGKTYAQMNSLERSNLKAEDAELFAQMREQAIQSGAI